MSYIVSMAKDKTSLPRRSLFAKRVEPDAISMRRIDEYCAGEGEPIHQDNIVYGPTLAAPDNIIRSVPPSFLPGEIIEQTAASVTRYLGKMSVAKVSRRYGRPLASQAHLTNEATKPWADLGMSRATWYRRKAKK